MELIWIEDFLALCRVQNFTRAAEAQGATQPAFSRRLQRLEEWLGCCLVQRGVRPLTLTPEGEVFRLRAERLREDMRDARRAVQSLSSHYAKPNRLFTTNTLAIGFFPKWSRATKLQNTTLIVASITACLEALRAGRADRALIPLFPNDEAPIGLDYEIVGQERLTLMATPDIAKLVRLEGKILRGPLLMYTPKTGYGAEIAARLTAMQVQLADPPLCESASAEALAAQAREGLGAAWIPHSLMTDDLVTCKMPKALESCSKILLLRKA